MGQVKTRLAQGVGEREALRIYTWLLHDALTRFAWLPFGKSLYVDGTGLEELAAKHGMDVRPQIGEGLGERMAAAINQCLQEASAVVLVGVDVPHLDADYVEQAFERLRADDLVLGPTEDGGYCLIGMKRLVPDVFADMPWGTRDVCARTIAVTEALGLTVACLARLWDVDRAEDVLRLNVSRGGALVSK